MRKITNTCKLVLNFVLFSAVMAFSNDYPNTDIKTLEYYKIEDISPSSVRVTVKNPDDHNGFFYFCPSVYNQGNCVSGDSKLFNDHYIFDVTNLSAGQIFSFYLKYDRLTGGQVITTAEDSFVLGNGDLVHDLSSTNNGADVIHVVDYVKGGNSQIKFDDGLTITAPMVAFDGSTIQPDGSVVNGDVDMIVNGVVTATEIRVVPKSDISIPDYVFEEDYKLRSLKDVEAYVKEHKHLPEVPSEAEMRGNGISLTEMNLMLLKKVEELTLYTIQLKSELDELKNNVE